MPNSEHHAWSACMLSCTYAPPPFITGIVSNGASNGAQAQQRWRQPWLKFAVNYVSFNLRTSADKGFVSVDIIVIMLPASMLSLYEIWKRWEQWCFSYSKLLLQVVVTQIYYVIKCPTELCATSLQWSWQGQPALYIPYFLLANLPTRSYHTRPMTSHNVQPILMRICLYFTSWLIGIIRTILDEIKKYTPPQF